MRPGSSYLPATEPSVCEGDVDSLAAMPPLFSSLAAALLSPETRTKPSSGDVFGINVSEMRLPPSLPPPSPTRGQHPAVAMAVAYSLFLIGRGSAESTAPDRRRRRRPFSTEVERLPVAINLCAPGAVMATEEEGGGSRDSVPRSPGYDDDSDVARWEVDLARASDLRSGKRDIAIVTTAAMPWMTGTSVNPALRAVYLAKDGHRVTLVVPWLPTLEEQRKLFSKGSPTFRTPEEQREYIREWGRKQVPGAEFDVLFYEGAYSHDFGSILPVGAITDVFAPANVVKDVCILEEPEHLTWHHSGKVWTELFNLVVGIIHTNYIEYAKKYGFFGPQKAMALLFLNVWVCRGYCHRIIKLSDAVQEFPNSITSNVHGVRDKFIDIGRRRSGPFPKGAYFMGKVLWAKGYRDLIDNMVEHHHRTGEALPIDFFGAGSDVEEVQAEIAAEPGLAVVNFDARVADPTGTNLQGYKVFVNASRSDVVCTATAEALSMGKLVVCLEHPSNEFFSGFPNCRTYRTPAEFSTAVRDALKREPLPLSESDAYRLTWEAATERLYDAVRLPLSKSKPSKVNIALANVHASLSKIYPQPGKGIRKANSKEVLQVPSDSA